LSFMLVRLAAHIAVASRSSSLKETRGLRAMGKGL